MYLFGSLTSIEPSKLAPQDRKSTDMCRPDMEEKAQIDETRANVARLLKS